VTRGVPPRGRVARPRGDDASAVVKELVPGLVIRLRTPGRSRTSGRRCWRPRRHRDSSARCGNARMTVCAQSAGANAGERSEDAARYQRVPGAPSSAIVRRPDLSSFPRTRPGSHACAPKLNGDCSRSSFSAVNMRAIGTTW